MQGSAVRRRSDRYRDEESMSIKLLVAIVIGANVAYHACESLFTKYVLPWF